LHASIGSLSLLSLPRDFLIFYRVSNQEINKQVSIATTTNEKSITKKNGKKVKQKIKDKIKYIKREQSGVRWLLHWL
jgi:hypothetical protein